MTTGFFEKVWALVAQIPYGKVASYGQIATMLGNPRAARTVGWALSSTPKEMDIPWHRVINSKGQISLGDTCASGEIQKNLLESEGIEINARGQIDLQKYGWKPDIDLE